MMQDGDDFSDNDSEEVDIENSESDTLNTIQSIMVSNEVDTQADTPLFQQPHHANGRTFKPRKVERVFSGNLTRSPDSTAPATTFRDNDIVLVLRQKI
ncbi:hypothetical protein TNCV_2264531 [Trichonephila clavipes]|nr:hypothetical protein TNCV_2264531 [Trichonephila clavipes]